MQSRSIGTDLEILLTEGMCSLCSWRLILTTHSVTLRPTNEVGEDGWQFLIFGREIDITKIVQSEELIFETIASIVPTEITFSKLPWVTDFRCVHVFSTGIDGRSSVSSRANIRMVNKFSEGRVFVAGGMYFYLN